MEFEKFFLYGKSYQVPVISWLYCGNLMLVMSQQDHQDWHVHDHLKQKKCFYNKIFFIGGAPSLGSNNIDVLNVHVKRLMCNNIFQADERGGQNTWGQGIFTKHLVMGATVKWVGGP